MRKLLVSTGTMVARENGFNYIRALNEIKKLHANGYCDGLELMMLVHYYDRFEDVTRAVRECGVEATTIHCEKEVGTLISDAGMYFSLGKNDDGAAAITKAKELFEYNCRFAEELMIPRMVLHLWGGFNSDLNIEYNVGVFPELEETAEKHGTRILVENIPSQKTEPLTNWHILLPSLGKAGLIFDTRFGKLHEQSADILSDEEIVRKIEHIHISDFAGKYREFKALRPILHPGEGSVAFDEIFALLDKNGYDNTVTLESPVAEGEDLNIPRLCRTLAYLRYNLGRKR